MKRHLLIGTALAAALCTAGTAAADGGESAGKERRASYYFAFDEAALRRDIARIRQFYAAPDSDVVTGPEAAAGAPESQMVFLGGRADGGFVGFWDGGAATADGVGGAPASWLDRVEFGFDWQPYVAEAKQRDPRRISRLMTAGEVDQVGVRADLTALLPPDARAAEAASAWHITGTLGSTSLSLASDVPADSGAGSNLAGDLYWDIGVGWSSGPMSLSAGYETTYREIEGVPAGMAVLSFGADYAVLPGVSVYGEFNVVDDPAFAAEQGLGTVIILGTGLNF